MFVLLRAFMVSLLTVTLAGCIRPEPTTALTPPVADTTLCTPSNLRECLPSPNGQWVAEINGDTGTLLHNAVTGSVQELFPADTSNSAVSWSPDSRQLIVMRSNWQSDSTGAVQVAGLPQLWQLFVAGDQASSPTLVFDTDQTLPNLQGIGPGQLVLGNWSPDSHYLLFWVGPLSASIQSDGLPFLVLDTTTQQTALLAEVALLNPRYHSWAPDGSALAYTAGGYRSAQVNKWLNLWHSGTGQITTVISVTEQVPGIVAWSPRGDRLAYAAVMARETSAEWADQMTFDNPAIASRRIYLLDPTTGHYQRFNDVETFQDAPVWREDGVTLYYVQRDDAAVALMAANLTTGQATMIEASRQPLPDQVGYYGQGEWEKLLEYRH